MAAAGLGAVDSWPNVGRLSGALVMGSPYKSPGSSASQPPLQQQLGASCEDQLPPSDQSRWARWWMVEVADPPAWLSPCPWACPLRRASWRLGALLPWTPPGTPSPSRPTFTQCRPSSRAGVASAALQQSVEKEVATVQAGLASLSEQNLRLETQKMALVQQVRRRQGPAGHPLGTRCAPADWPAGRREHAALRLAACCAPPS
jgi:hypothetical protein